MCHPVVTFSLVEDSQHRREGERVVNGGSSLGQRSVVHVRDVLEPFNFPVLLFLGGPFSLFFSLVYDSLVAQRRPSAYVAELEGGEQRQSGVCLGPRVGDVQA